MADKKKKVGKVKKKKAEPIRESEGKEVKAEEAIVEEPVLKVRTAKHGVMMMTQSQYDDYVKERDKK